MEGSVPAAESASGSAPGELCGELISSSFELKSSVLASEVERFSSGLPA
jgi:hypothetical protein